MVKLDQVYVQICLFIYICLQVSMDIEGKNSWKKCFSSEGVSLPTGYYYGASAATGDLAGE